MNKATIANNINFKAVQNMSLSETSRYIKKSLKSTFPAVKFSVTSRCSYGIYIRFTETSEVSKQDVINVVGMFSKYSDETLHVNNSTVYYSCTDTYKEEQKAKYEQEQKELEQKRQAREKIYNDNVKVDGIYNAKITNVEDKDIFVIALEPSVNKNDWKIDNDKYINKCSRTFKYKITDIVELNEAEYNYFCFNLLNDYDFLNEKGGTYFDDDTQEFLYNCAVAIVCKDKETLIIDPQGYSYARYTCRLAKDIDNKLKDNINYTININNKLDSIINSIDNTCLYIYSKSKLNSRLENKILQDTRFIYSEYMGVVVITGLAYKELLAEGKRVDTNLNKLNISINVFLSNILKMENGIHFAERLKEELSRANNRTIPDPPKPTKKDAIELKKTDTNINTKVAQINNIITVDFNKHTINNNWKQDQATAKQLWALHCITKLNTTNLKITKGQASILISKANKKINIKIEVQKLLQQQQLLQA
ncbi:hypothetical protein CLOHAE12215_01324 [Clostridium haemolyticum]|uniref:LPD29 domain-containing protein n=1 Tax=Clostridium haemolyticum TaxID=84025 RepID=UPI001C3AF620|nr:LPD29 domain-containing protein [Clostridium haemolyticum]CAG7839908.1 hypothetical protein CLOHAE12215_01324 [Clostridium haemolyticum]